VSSAQAPIDPKYFVAAVTPLLEEKDLPRLLCFLKGRWNIDQIAGLLACECHDARKVAALALSLVGGKCSIEPLAQRLQDKDPMVNQMAEHALWSIWFRCGCGPANHELARGAQAVGRREIEHAIEHFNRAIEIASDFAEAYNQRAIAYYLLEQYPASLADCQRTVDLMPCHFGAWAGMGHCHAHQGRLRDAVRCYEKALALNPHLDCLHQAVIDLKAQL